MSSSSSHSSLVSAAWPFFFLKCAAWPFFILFISFTVVNVQATVSPSKTFKYVNQGEFGEYIVEYGADYRNLPLQKLPFALCFYNTTPNAFTLGLRFGNRRSESIMRWVWDANRGNPVRENATLSFSRDGNLVLADVDGKVAWQTGTANKGVVDIQLLSNGNLVLLNNRGGFVWQSFDHPTDTLLVDQSLRANGPSKLISRASNVDGSEGDYSLVLEPSRFVFYQKTKNSLKPLLYHLYDQGFNSAGDNVTFYVEPVNIEGSVAYAYELQYKFGQGGAWILSRPKYNATLSMLRIESDGNLKMYTYNNKVDWGAWEVTYSLFSGKGGSWVASECKSPTKCGALGVCEDEQCVACPSAKGLMGWSKSCAPAKQGTCTGKGAKKGNYFKVVGVEHYMVSEGDGPLNVAQCKKNCDKDCGCLGFFYREESSKCLLAPVLGTLTKVANSSHVAYIKM